MGKRTQSDIASYLSFTSESLLFHFNDTVHNNFFAANESVLSSFTVSQGSIMTKYYPMMMKYIVLLEKVHIIIWQCCLPKF